MVLPKPADAIHRAWLYRILSAIADNAFLIEQLRFKGGTCAAMRGLIDRFSVDLDFDLLDAVRNDEIQKNLETIFLRLGLEIKDKSKKVPQYFLKYTNTHGDRTTVRLDVTFPPPVANEYEPVRFAEIDRILFCQTVPTMFANKLVTVQERFAKFGSLAGRDLFDIHVFFMKGFLFNEAVIEERTGKKAAVFLKDLKKFITEKMTQTIIDQDLNTLLPPQEFQKIRKTLKHEVLLSL